MVGLLAELLRHHEEQVVGRFAEVALPEIQKVHVVDRCLAPLHLKEDPSLV
jgi:hypothetical protein